MIIFQNKTLLTFELLLLVGQCKLSRIISYLLINSKLHEKDHNMEVETEVCYCQVSTKTENFTVIMNCRLKISLQTPLVFLCAELLRLVSQRQVLISYTF